MPIFRFLFLAFLLIPLVEIYLLIQVGEVIGAGWTVFLVVGTAVLGAALLKHQGLATLHDAQARLNRGELPATSLVEGILLLVSGALLLTPGFFTDTLGFIVLVPMFRKGIASYIVSRGLIMSSSSFSAHYHADPHQDSRPQGGNTIEGDFTRRDD